MTDSRILIDTDVLIQYLRGDGQAIDFLESLDHRPAISVICVAELMVGVRDDHERQAVEGFLSTFDELPVDATIARSGAAYRRAYMGSHNTGLADALIAATVAEHGLRLATFNARHYPMLEDVLIPYSRH